MSLPQAQNPGNRRFRLFRSVAALMLREMSTTYGRSPGGYFWMVLEPVAGIALLSYIFSLIARAPAIGQNFALFFATGVIAFQIYVTISNLTAHALRYSKPFLAYPAVTFLDALLARIFLNTLTQLLVATTVIYGIIVFYDLSPILNWYAICNAIGMTLCFSVAVGLINCYFFTVFPLWERLWMVINRPLFILSGVFFIPEGFSSQLRDVYMLLPWPHMTSEMRRGFYATYDAVHVNSAYIYIISLILMVLGMVLLLRNHKQIAQL